jgi:hypothetical protein
MRSESAPNTTNSGMPNSSATATTMFAVRAGTLRMF